MTDYAVQATVNKTKRGQLLWILEKLLKRLSKAREQKE